MTIKLTMLGRGSETKVLGKNTAMKLMLAKEKDLCPKTLKLLAILRTH